MFRSPRRGNFVSINEIRVRSSSSLFSLSTGEVFNNCSLIEHLNHIGRRSAVLSLTDKCLAECSVSEWTTKEHTPIEDYWSRIGSLKSHVESPPEFVRLRCKKLSTLYFPNHFFLVLFERKRKDLVAKWWMCLLRSVCFLIHQGVRVVSAKQRRN